MMAENRACSMPFQPLRIRGVLTQRLSRPGLLVSLFDTLVHRDTNRRRWDAVCYDHKRTRPGLHRGWHIEVGGYDLTAGGNAHGAVVVRSGVENVSTGVVCNAYERIVRGRVKLITVRGRLRQAIELRTG